jgi:predicted glycosyltransferase
MRISFGLQIPNIMFNDEPRSFGPCKMTFPYVDKIIVPLCIPLEWYLEYGLKEEMIIRFNGIDEIAWLSEFVPNPQILTDLNLEPEHYVICRTEPTEAGYLIDKLAPYQTHLTEILPDLIKQTTDFKYLILTRNNNQFDYLNKFFSRYKLKNTVSIYKGLDNLTNFMYYAKMVMTGGGTMVRESALLGVPSIEFIPLITYPQEQYLINNGYPLIHEKDTKNIITEALKFLEGDFKINTFQKIKSLENPINISLKEFYKRFNK